MRLPLLRFGGLSGGRDVPGRIYSEASLSGFCLCRYESLVDQGWCGQYKLPQSMFPGDIDDVKIDLICQMKWLGYAVAVPPPTSHKLAILFGGDFGISTDDCLPIQTESASTVFSAFWRYLHIRDLQRAWVIPNLFDFGQDLIQAFWMCHFCYVGTEIVGTSQFGNVDTKPYHLRKTWVGLSTADGSPSPEYRFPLCK